MAGRGLPQLGLPRRSAYADYPRLTDAGKAEDPRAERGEALRDRRSGGVPAARRGRDPGATGRRAARRDQHEHHATRPRALGEVIDPELDEPITTLRFVSSCDGLADGDVAVRLRLPTPQCAPNFAFLMAADARDAVRRLPGVRRVDVELEDHYTGDEINAAIRARRGLRGRVPGRVRRDDLRRCASCSPAKRCSHAKAGVCESLLPAGHRRRVVPPARPDLPDAPDARRCLELRGAISGLLAGRRRRHSSCPTATVRPPDDFERWRRMARLVGTSLEANGGICRSLLEFRHGLTISTEEVSR